MIISAKEAREIQNKVNGNEEQLLRIQEQIKKEAAKKQARRKKRDDDIIPVEIDDEDTPVD